MTRLTINGQLAVIKSGTSIKLTRENYMFSDSGDYTLDVTLPLKGCIENQRIFGAAHRIEVDKTRYQGKRYIYRLGAWPMALGGTAVITSITNEEVKIQLISGNSELNLRCTNEDGSDIYIDELELGYCWQTVWNKARSVIDPFYKVEMPTLRNWLTMFLNRTLDNTLLLWMSITTENTMRGTSDLTDSVCLPIYSATDGGWANQMALNIYKESQGDEANTMTYWGPRLFFKQGQAQTLPGKADEKSKGIFLEGGYCLAPQPYMCWVIELLFNALGYHVASNALRNSDKYKNMFIANCKATTSLKNILPHWTVKEFLKEVMLLCNVKFVADRDIVSIVDADEAATQHIVELSEVLDEYSADIDQEAENEDLSTGNVGYKFDNPNNYLVLPSEIWENAEVVSFGTMQAFSDFYEKHKEEDDRFKYLMITPNGKYIYKDTGLLEVDGMGPARRNLSSVEIARELRIVPVELSFDENTFIQDIWVHNSIENPEANVYYGRREYKEGGVAMITNGTRSFADTECYNIGMVLEGNNEESDGKRDIIEVGCLGQQYSNNYMLNVSGGESGQFSHEGGFGIPYIMESGTYKKWGGTPLTFMIENLPSLNMSAKCATQTEWQIQFADKGLFSAMDTYMIRGRLFRCLKIEFTIDDSGLQPVKRGFFYEVL